MAGPKVWASGDILTAADLNKFGEGMWGNYSGTTDAGGKLVVTHSAGFTPTSVLITPSSPTSTNLCYPLLFAVGATTFTIQFVATAGSAATLAVTGCFYVLA